MIHKVAHITRAQMHALQTRLRRRARELVREIGDGVKSGGLEQEPFAPADIEEASVEAMQIDRDTLELHAIRDALDRMDRGTYGTCSQCGSPIPLKRLDAEPEAERCAPCEEIRERGRRKPATL